VSVDEDPTTVVCLSVDVQDEYAGQLNADFDFVDTCCKVSLSASFRN
jgi:hypothetical protein